MSGRDKHIRRSQKRLARKPSTANRRGRYLISGTLKWSFNDRSKHDEYPWMAAPGERWDWSYVPSWQTARHLSLWPLPRTALVEQRARRRRVEARAVRAEKAERMERNRLRHKKVRAQAHKQSSPPRRVLLYRQLERHR